MLQVDPGKVDLAVAGEIQQLCCFGCFASPAVGLLLPLHPAQVCVCILCKPARAAGTKDGLWAIMA